MKRLTTSVRGLRAELAHWLEVAQRVGPVTITSNGHPVAQLTSLPKPELASSLSKKPAKP